MALGIIGGLLFLAFNVLILLVIHWYVAGEQTRSGKKLKSVRQKKLFSLETLLFGMREPSRRREMQRWAPPPNRKGS